MKGIAHRKAQTCSRCSQIYMWQPGQGLCPYCDLSQHARTTSLNSGGFDTNRCPPSCCPSEGGIRA
jgi:hypothetical protein